ncbi:ankyrin repeat-containing protein [Burkholderiales bacterium JOSHI_001]|nr:ankyrin repeat-containing protein [Burkholderiales bacterium JOSHI_001]
MSPESSLSAWLAANGFADVHTPAQHGNTPLMHAAWKGERDIAQALLDAGVDRAATNGDGNNALWLACVSRDLDLVRRLVASGVPIDHANFTGATALMYAASSGRTEVLKLLLALGANPRLTSQDDFSALDMAANLECLTLLRSASRAAA